MRTVSTTALRRISSQPRGMPGEREPGRGARWRTRFAPSRASSSKRSTAVERSHRIALGSRVGAYPRETVSRLLGEGKIFEYWAHEACLIPVEEWPLFRLRMTRHHPWRGDVIAQHPELAEEVLAAIRERWPAGRRATSTARAAAGMWSWKPAKLVLEALWNSGELVIAGRVSGLPALLMSSPSECCRARCSRRPVPDEATRDRELAVRAVRARGALTESGIVEHWRMAGGTARIRPSTDALVAGGHSRAASRRGWRRRRARPRRRGSRPASAVDRSAALALRQPPLGPASSPAGALGFDHLIEVYKRAHERQYGYYVLPLLWRDRIVGRADLKSSAPTARSS